MVKSARLKFDKLLHDTGKAILIRVNSSDHWIPKSLCRKLTINNKLGGHVCLPSFIIERLGINIEDLDPEIIVTHHVPKKIKKQVDHDSDLFR